MKKIFLPLLVLLGTLTVFAANETIWLSGRVKTAITNDDLTNAYVLLYDSLGNITDSIQANQGMRWSSINGIDTMSYFGFNVPRVDSIIVFDVVCEGFKPQTVTYALTDIKKRETSREIPTIFMERAPRRLKEVTVTATKIKFYNKGDTTVYNADAFELAEGSMLDALVAQLPGAELSPDGQIKINGQFVESLLLDGKQFFDGNNNLMLENIAAYTVKDIAVYEGYRKQDVQMGTEREKILTMDVRLKKEYNIGWILNLQGGYGTEDRYLGKAFISWFNPKWRVSLIGNVNNLNDNRQPGRNDTWTPDMLPSGRKEFRNIGIDYNFETPDEKTSANGQLVYRQTIDNVIRNTDRTNFLQTGDTYERSFANSDNRQDYVSTRHYFFHRNDKIGTSISLQGNYEHSKNDNYNIAGTFDKDPGELSREILDAIYTDGSNTLLTEIINRSKTQTDGWKRNRDIFFGPSLFIKMPNSTDDRLYFSTYVSYSDEKEELWKDYEINYGGINPYSQKLRQFFDNSPNRTVDLSGRVGYSTRLGPLYLSLDYSYVHTECTKDSYMYALDRLSDMGIYGTLPSDYLLAFDPANSYTSRRIQNRHNFDFYLSYGKSFNDGNSRMYMHLDGRLSYLQRNFTYRRNNEEDIIKASNILFSLPHQYAASIAYYNGKYGRGEMRNQFRYNLLVTYTVPDLFNMVNIVDDTDPLNIYVGNPYLKTGWRIRHQFWWIYKPETLSFNNDFSVSYTSNRNDQSRGYTYDTSTGVRYFKMYNINGNHTFAVSDNLSWQFGTKKQFSMTFGFDAGFSQEGDMIGIDMSEPKLNRVHNFNLNERFKIGWQMGKQNIGLRCDVVERRTTSSQNIFNTINATHVNAGIQGVFVLPQGFGISTDFMCYTRRGYGVAYLDTTDPVWNLRVSYAPPRNSHWVFMVDGFDMLHQLSNISYAVSATGRTISYTNTLPRYLLFTVQYRLNIQPKKR